MIEVKAPHPYAQHKGIPSVFLAGSIEMGVAEDWQKKVTVALASWDVLVLNPRRELRNCRFGKISKIERKAPSPALRERAGGEGVFLQ